jgi:3-isopropylmalate/(R)-2-methylmalate dehydratase small subunit
LGKGLFYEMRFDADGNPNPDFVLNREPYTKSEILIGGENFGCGSSREHAPWSLLDFGFRAVIAPSFGDIFYNNCFKNGILPVTLKEEEVAVLMDAAASGTEITVNLNEQKVVCGNSVFEFEIDPFRKHCLLNGLDDIGLTLEKESFISTYETKNKQEKPWLWQS